MTTQVNAKTAAFLLSDAGRKILEAIESHKSLQFRPRGPGTLANEPWADVYIDVNTFNLDPARFEWRVKPEPRTLYAVVRNNGVWVHYATDRAEAEDRLKACNGNRFTEYHPYRIEEYRQVV